MDRQTIQRGLIDTKDIFGNFRNVLPLAIILIILLIVAVGFLFSILWGWFIVPLGAPPINTAHGIGLSMMLGFVRGDIKIKAEGGIKSAVVSILAAIALVLIIAFVAHLFI